jgi:hypothetical protein
MCFHPPSHDNFTLQNNTLWKITHHIVHVKNQYFLKVRRYVQFNVGADHEWTKMDINEQPRKIKSCYPIEIYKNWIDIQNMER